MRMEELVKILAINKVTNAYVNHSIMEQTWGGTRGNHPSNAPNIKRYYSGNVAIRNT